MGKAWRKLWSTAELVVIALLLTACSQHSGTGDESDGARDGVSAQELDGGLEEAADGADASENASRGVDASPSDAGDRDGSAFEQTIFEVSYRDDAVILDEVPEVTRALLHADLSAGMLTFDRNLPGVERLTPGAAALLGGVGIYHIEGREETAEGIVLQVSSGSLTDVIESGHIAFRRRLVTPDATDRVGLGVDGDPLETIRRGQKSGGTFKDGVLNYTGKLGSFDTSMKIEKQSDGINLSLGAKWQGDVAVINAAASATIHDMKSETEVVITDREVKYLLVRFVDVDGEAHINAGAVEIGGDAKITVPVRLALPVPIGPIPFTVAVGTSLEFSSTLTSNTSATVNASAKFKGSAGVKIDGKKRTWFSQFSPPELTVEHAEQVGTVGAGAGFLLNFPELSVGVGYASVAKAEAFLHFKTEVVTNFSVEYSVAGPFPVLSGSCIETGTNFGVTFGGTASFAGAEVAMDEEQLYGKIGDMKRSGSSCPK